MDLKEIKKILGLETLNEDQQKDVEEKLVMLIEVKAKEKVDELLVEEKDRLVEEYETKFEEYKTEITSKFSNFVDSILDEELEIPQVVLDYARKGEMYNDLIEDFKKRLAIDEGVLTEDVKSLLKEAKEELLKQKDEINRLTSQNMEISTDAKEMASQLYLHQKCEGLTEEKRKKVFGLIGGITEKKEIDRRFDFVLEHVLGEEDSGNFAGGEGTDPDAASNVNICPQCGAQFSAEGEGGIDTCPKCGAKMEDAVASIEPAGDGTGNAVVDPETKVATEEKKIEESSDPWEEKMKMWKKILKENKI